LDNTLDYALSQEGGAVFPAPVIAKVEGKGKLLIAGGNHRIGASELNGHESVMSHVISVDEHEFLLLAKLLNRVEGARLDRSEAISLRSRYRSEHLLI
jgi:hypothetical protein